MTQPNGSTHAPGTVLANHTQASHTESLEESDVTATAHSEDASTNQHLASEAVSYFPEDAAHFDSKSQPHFQPLATQVAGHDGVLSDRNGYVIIKPCHDAEIAFYERCLSEAPDMADCIPAFMGTLELKTPETLASLPPEVSAAVSAAQAQGVLPKESTAAPPPTNRPADAKAYSPPSTTFDRAVVLENLTYGYQHPCVLDLKIGSILTADDATPEKQARLAAVSQRTTSGSAGIRVAGMKVWDAQLKRYVTFDRDWGKSLTPQTLDQHALACFFSAKIRQEQIQLIATRFLEDIERILYVLGDLEVRIFSASLLFVYEGDQTALDLAIEEEGKQLIEDELGHGITHTDSRGSTGSTHSTNSSRMARSHGSHPSRRGTAIPSDIDSDEESDAARDFCICRLIDFAHAKFTPGQGTDQNLLMGLKAARTLVEDFLDREFAPQLD
ncbi:hypothetical protein BCR37DRAFT_375905 [Protomyces lactucae-debilis]|uniref:Kinase n=1 Tax=Protomyces lactucae-debilis TaxID=2754530 RepID=A0A1Y2FWM5_PROLT|nr:uncharacterized protein BCR37DRAFT_375905 [Protomyces lactucae-debilis]ORY87937.1 hypothetical protein BCR37DRAFT_375905 [Protomyces lactucae-debilis]